MLDALATWLDRGAPGAEARAVGDALRLGPADDLELPRLLEELGHARQAILRTLLEPGAAGAAALAGGDEAARGAAAEELAQLEAGLDAALAGAVAWSLDRRDRQAARLGRFEQRYIELFESSPDAILVHQDGRVVMANAAAAALLGARAPAELVGRAALELFHPDCHALIRRRHAGLAAGERQSTVEERIVRLDGEVRDVEVASASFPFEQGLGVQVLIRDVTERRRAQEALRQTAERLQRLVDANPIGVVMGDGGGQVLEANDAYLRIIGCTRDALQAGAIRWDTITPPEHLAADARAVAEARARGVSAVYEKEYLRPDGRRVPVLVACASFGGEGQLVAFVVDIGDRKAAEEALRASEERARTHAAELEAVLDTVPAAVWIARDARGDRIDANRAGAALLRHPPGWNVSVTAPGGDAPRHFKPMRHGRPLAPDELPIQRAARFGEEIRDAELDLLFEDGTVRHLLGNASPLRDARGVTQGSVGAFIDVTELRQAAEALREADRRKTEFLAVLSHELRNPLAAVGNALRVLETAPPGSPPALRAREVLRRQSDQLARLVDDLLDVSRIAHGKIELRQERVDAREVARRAYADARALFEQRRVQLFLAEAAEPLWVDADPARLSQMVGNLLHNALKFTPPRGRVELQVARRAGACEIAVQDTGVGLEPSELERIFDPFVQAERTRAGQGGLGIGLALVRELAARHGGTVRATSRGPGLGARFALQLPSRPPPERAAGRAPLLAGAAGLSVLIVEDNEDAASTLADLLALSGNRVSTAGTGEAAVSAAADVRPDVVICDIGLPDMSGHDVIRAIRAREGDGRVFAMALTGYAQPHDRAQALAAGFDAHLPKPPPLEELQALLAEVARRRAGG